MEHFGGLGLNSPWTTAEALHVIECRRNYRGFLLIILSFPLDAPFFLPMFCSILLQTWNLTFYN